MCCPKGKCGCQYFILLTLKKQFMDTGVLDFFNKKLILDSKLQKLDWYISTKHIYVSDEYSIWKSPLDNYKGKKKKN
jgi:hypothetical protein